MRGKLSTTGKIGLEYSTAKWGSKWQALLKRSIRGAKWDAFVAGTHNRERVTRHTRKWAMLIRECIPDDDNYTTEL